MSHWTTIKVKAKDRKAIIAALKRLFPKNTVEENVQCRGYSGMKRKADIVVKGKGTYDLGFSQNKDKEYDCVADWYGANREFGNQKAFEGKFNQAYSTEVIRAKAKAKGYGLQEKTLADGKIQLTVTEYGY